MDPAALSLTALWLSFPFGLAWGSFLNVCIHRLPRSLSVVRPRSACPSCGTEISAGDNIPLVSYVLLRGRCRQCSASISIRYPVVELITGLMALGLILQGGLTFLTLSRFLFLSAMLVLFFTDFDLKLLPDLVTIPGAAIGLLLSCAPGTIDFASSLIGMVMGWVLVMLTARLYLRVRGVEGMGMGDAKMMALIGAFLGWKLALLTLLLGSFLGSIAGILLILIGRGSFQAKLPFGSFLAVAAVVCLFWGDRLVVWYSSLFL